MEQEEEIIFFSTHCPMCRALEMQLKSNKIKYIEENDIDKIKAHGLHSVPALSVDGVIMTFKEALVWLKSRGK